MTPEQTELIHEGEELEKSLGNGRRGDPGTMSDAIRYLIRINRIQLHAEYVSSEECLARMASRTQWNKAKAFSVLGSVFMVCGTVIGIVIKVFG